MKISVVIPLFNKAPHIINSIQSVLNQTFHEFEIIVVDDGSTDGGGDIVERINDSRILLIRQENAGVSTARNVGIEKANTDLVAFLDADDEWNTGFLKQIVSLYIQFPNCGAFATSFFYRKNGKLIPNPNNYNLTRGVINRYFFYVSVKPPFYTSSIVVLKRVFQNIGYFDEKLKNGEDHHMWSRIANKYDIAYSPKKCCIYNQDSINRACQSTERLKYKLDFISNMEILEREIKKEKKEDFREYVILNKLILSSEFLIIGEKKQAIKLLNESKITKRHKMRLYKWTILSKFPPDLIHKLLIIKVGK
jgi:glycosyltransferase involved in cell wall biosynthesis